jgi:hypothetical protein
MICIHGSERSKAITDNSEESNQDVVDHVDKIRLAALDINPAYIMQVSSCPKRVGLDSQLTNQK